MECKVVRERDGLERGVADGVEQTARYMERCAAEVGHLVLIDRRKNRSGRRGFRLRRYDGGTAAIHV